MTSTEQRDKAISLVKCRPNEALTLARKVPDPWFRAQALSWVARFTDGDPVPIAAEAAIAAKEGDDNYKKCAVRAWDIAALAEREQILEARKCLFEILVEVKNVEPASSRCEALLLLLQAGLKIAREDAETVFKVMEVSCQPEEHWRCMRALRNGGKMISGELPPRSFFW